MAVLFVLFLSSLVGAALVSDDPYYEYIPYRMTFSGVTPYYGWGSFPATELQHVVAVSATEFVFLGASGLFYGNLTGGDPPFVVRSISTPALTVEPLSRLIVNQDLGGTTTPLVAIAGPKGVTTLSCDFPYLSCAIVATFTHTLGGVRGGIYHRPSMSVWVACDLGLKLLDITSGSWKQIAITPFRAITYSVSHGLISASSEIQVLIYDANTRNVNRFEYVSNPVGDGGVIDAAPSSLSFDSNGALYVGTIECMNIYFSNFTRRRISGNSGLPYGNMTSIVASQQGDSRIWIGTRKGFEVFDWNTNAWRYFYGPRYHPGTETIALAVSGMGGGQTIVGIFDQGIAVLQSQLWTLEQKAAYFESQMPRHFRIGLVEFCNLQQAANISSCTLKSSQTDGLWTSLYVGAEAFRYAVTKDPTAQQLCMNSFSGMQFLNNVTGIKGLMARSAVPSNTTTSGGEWHNSTAVPGWQWLGDTSSDEVDGHIFAYSLISELLDDPYTVSAAKQLLVNIVEYIVDNGYYLIDVDGQPTTWGQWPPDLLNGEPSFCDNRGINSLEMIAMLGTAYKISGNQKFANSYSNLTNNINQYLQNMMNAKIVFPLDDNFSDDELMWLAYHSLFVGYIWDKDMASASISQTFSLIEHIRSDLWGSIIIGSLGASNVPNALNVAQDIRWNLRNWPLDLLNWPITNTHRKDYVRDMEPSEALYPYTRDPQIRSRDVLPANERGQFRWNTNPFILDISGDAKSEADPAAWLLPYWMARYYGIVAAPSN